MLEGFAKARLKHSCFRLSYLVNSEVVLSLGLVLVEIVGVVVVEFR